MTSQQSALDQAAEAAVTMELATGCPAEISLAQWALESGWGQHEPGNNCFGIKSYKGELGERKLVTKEEVHGTMVTKTQSFATFANLTDCFRKHAELLTTGELYRAAFQRYAQSKDLTAYLREIAMHYCTDSRYVSQILSLMHSDHCTAALAKARYY